MELVVPRSALEERSVPFLVLFSRNVAVLRSVLSPCSWERSRFSFRSSLGSSGMFPRNVPGTFLGPWGFTPDPGFSPRTLVFVELGAGSRPGEGPPSVCQ